MRTIERASRTKPRLGSSGRLVTLTLMAAFAAFAAFAAAQEVPAPGGDASQAWRSEFRQSYDRALAAAPFAPSDLSLRIAMAEGKRNLGALDPRQAATLALSFALEVERDMRFGATPQEARAYLRLYLRGGDSAGDRSFADAYGRDVVHGFETFGRTWRTGSALGSAMSGGTRGKGGQ
jgi:hypothetical protein